MLLGIQKRLALHACRRLHVVVQIAVTQVAKVDQLDAAHVVR